SRLYSRYSSPRKRGAGAHENPRQGSSAAWPGIGGGASEVCWRAFGAPRERQAHRQRRGGGGEREIRSPAYRHHLACGTYRTVEIGEGSGSGVQEARREPPLGGTNMKFIRNGRVRDKIVDALAKGILIAFSALVCLWMISGA